MELTLREREQERPETTDRLMERFGLLCTRAEYFLQDSGCTTQSLLVCVMDLKHVRSSVKSSTLKELESA